MLTVEYDETMGIIITRTQGLSSADDFDRYVPEMMKFMTKSIARHGRWLHLVISADSAVQARDSSDHVSQKWNAKARDDGWTAYVMQSVLKKMQIQRMRDDQNHAFFNDVDSARRWLLTNVDAASLLSA